MNRPERAPAYFSDESGAGTSIVEKMSDSALARVAEIEISRFDASTKIREPVSANGTSVSTDISPQKEIGVDLGVVARAIDFLTPVMQNSNSTKSQHLTLSPIQEWEGYVVDIANDHITANLVDLTADDKRSSFVAEIPLAELESSDIARLRPGLIFRWAVGYLRTSGGTKFRGSKIVFRDLPQWSKKEIEETMKQAGELANYFANGESHKP